MFVIRPENRPPEPVGPVYVENVKPGEVANIYWEAAIDPDSDPLVYTVSYQKSNDINDLYDAPFIMIVQGTPNLMISYQIPEEDRGYFYRFLVLATDNEGLSSSSSYSDIYQALSLRGFVRVDGEIVESNEMHAKVGNIWVPGVEVYSNVNGIWTRAK